MDIRSFFGGLTKSIKTEKSNEINNISKIESNIKMKKDPSKLVHAESRPSGIKRTHTDENLTDSDDENQTRNMESRKRLKATKQSQVSDEKSLTPFKNNDEVTLVNLLKKKSPDTKRDTGDCTDFESQSQLMSVNLSQSSSKSIQKFEFQSPLHIKKPSPRKYDDSITSSESMKPPPGPLKMLDHSKSSSLASETLKPVVGGAHSFFGSVTPDESNSIFERTVDLISPLKKEEKSETNLNSTKSNMLSPNLPSIIENDSHTPSSQVSSKKQIIPKRNNIEESIDENIKTKKTNKHVYYHIASHRGSNAPLLSEDRRFIPNGKPGCLANLKIAVTGQMNHMTREDMEDLLQRYGAKLANSVSGKTSLLVAGTILEDGRPVNESGKYKTAIEKKVRIVTEDEILNLVQASNPTDQPIDWNESLDNVSSPPPIISANQYFNSSFKSSANTDQLLLKPSLMDPKSSQSKSFLPPTQSTSNAAMSSVLAPPPAELEGTLWVDKYRPRRTSDLVGAGEILKKLQDWLRTWSLAHIEKKLKIPFTKENPGAKAALLSGPPGIGKTTLATLVASEMGYEVLELNASDTRSKKAITEQLADVVLSNAIGSDGRTHKRLIIMDEVDGMGGSDRGGIPELIKVIKGSRNPIICICNDRQSQKIRSLANHCYDLRVRRPTKNQIAQRMVNIAREEGLSIDTNAAEILVEQMGNDIRQVINCLQMWRAQSHTLRYDDMKQRLHSIEKDKILRQTPFDACQSILGGSKSSFDDRYNSFFIDYALVPLLIQQNYIESAKNGVFKIPGSDALAMKELAKAADAVSDMGLIQDGIIGQDQHWELLPTAAAMCVTVGHHVRGFQPFPNFPAWLGKYSSTGKAKRQVQEIVTHTSLSIGQGFSSIRMEYIPYLRSALLKELQTGGDSVEKVIELMDAYGLSRDDVTETMKDLQLLYEKDPLLRDQYNNVDSKTKAAFTRLYNSMDHRSQALASTLVASKKGRRATHTGNDGDEDGLEEGTTEDLAAAQIEEDNEDEDNDVGDVSAFVKKNKSTAAKRKASATSSSSSANNGPIKKGKK